MTDNTAWPTELRVAQDRKSLLVAFDDGYSGTISAELLRVRSPSAEVQGHSPSERKTVPGKIHVMILGVEPGHGVKDLAVDGIDRLLHALAAPDGLVPVAQFDRLMGPG